MFQVFDIIFKGLWTLFKNNLFVYVCWFHLGNSPDKVFQLKPSLINYYRWLCSVVTVLRIVCLPRRPLKQRLQRTRQTMQRLSPFLILRQWPAVTMEEQAQRIHPVMWNMLKVEKEFTQNTKVKCLCYLANNKVANYLSPQAAKINQILCCD